MASIEAMLSETFRFVMGAAAQRKVCASIPMSHVVGDRFAEETLISDQCYFQISLAEMFIRDRRQYWFTFLPFVLVLAEFIFNNERTSVPVFAGEDFQFLKSIEKFIHGESVEYRNIPLIGPTPYMGGGIKLFIGLFRTQNEDLSRRIFDVVNAIARVTPVTELGLYMSLAAPIEKGVASILGIKEVQLRIGVAQQINDSSDANPTSAGYVALVNATEVRGQMWVQNGELWVGDDKPDERFTDADYCLVRVEFLRSRSVTDLSFAKLWNRIKELVWQGETPKAEALLLELGRQLATSPDLTTEHRFQLIALYKVNLEREIELWNKTRAPAQRIYKGAADVVGGKIAVSQILARLPEGSTIRKGIAGLVANWESLVKAYESPDSELTDQVIQRQLSRLNELHWTAREPEELLKVLALSVIG
jgi:hypothetical protein